MNQTQESLDELVDKWSSIKKKAFKVAVGVVFSIAIISVFARAAIRLKTRRRTTLDDYLLFIAAAFLTGSTGLVYHLCDTFYLTTAIQQDLSIIYHTNSQQLTDIINNATQQNSIFLVITWTATFFVKFSFLAFFKQLIRQVDGIQYYYWAVVVLTVVSWIFLISEPFILCSDFGAKSVACFDHSKDLLYVSMTGLITGLDALSDILIASIPIIVLHRARIHNTQKISLGLFLCLSLVMVCFAIIRVANIHGVAGVNVPWEFFWQFIEASVAVIMGSLTVFRTLLTPMKSSDEQRHNRARAIVLRPHEHFSYRMRFLRMKKKHIDLESHDGLPDIPNATMTGIRTFIQVNNRDLDIDAEAPLTNISQQETLAGNDDTRQLIMHIPHSFEAPAEWGPQAKKTHDSGV